MLKHEDIRVKRTEDNNREEQDDMFLFVKNIYGEDGIALAKLYFRKDYEAFHNFLSHTSYKKEVITFLGDLCANDELSGTTALSKKSYFQGKIESELYQTLLSSWEITKDSNADHALIAEYGVVIVHALKKIRGEQRFKRLLESFDTKASKETFIYTINSILDRDKSSLAAKNTVSAIQKALQKNIDSHKQSINIDYWYDVFKTMISENRKGNYYIVAPNHIVADNFFSKNMSLPYDYYGLEHLFQENGSSCGPVALVNRPLEEWVKMFGVTDGFSEDVLKEFVAWLYNGFPVFKNREDEKNKITNSKKTHAAFVAKKNKPTNVIWFPSGTQTPTLDEEMPLMKNSAFNDKWFPGRLVVPVFVAEYPRGYFHYAFWAAVNVTKPEGVSRAAHLTKLLADYKVTLQKLKAKLVEKGAIPADYDERVLRKDKLVA